jgi:hypothetical protein
MWRLTLGLYLTHFSLMIAAFLGKQKKFRFLTQFHFHAAAFFAGNQ